MRFPRLEILIPKRATWFLKGTCQPDHGGTTFLQPCGTRTRDYLPCLNDRFLGFPQICSDCEEPVYGKSQRKGQQAVRTTSVEDGGLEEVAFTCF